MVMNGVVRPIVVMDVVGHRLLGLRVGGERA
jgi:hypothetical protein